MQEAFMAEIDLPALPPFAGQETQSPKNVFILNKLQKSRHVYLV